MTFLSNFLFRLLLNPLLRHVLSHSEVLGGSLSVRVTVVKIDEAFSLGDEVESFLLRLIFLDKLVIRLPKKSIHQ